MFWIAFNIVFIWQSIQFIGRLKPFVKAQTLGWEMRWVYTALPIAFALMTIRILQVNYRKLVRGSTRVTPTRSRSSRLLNWPRMNSAPVTGSTRIER
ncbi:TRAP transporter small permease subunit [Paracoccus mutanolyticus]|uniref:TRAP transporter small permease subunit n=1 Tax=Paracoccus mutanolyticus TaxID=1499308 RepID=UPI001CB9B5F0|nr:TRAP transporter small permease subunit [Paracoccus mutanolyticus]